MLYFNSRPYNQTLMPCSPVPATGASLIEERARVALQFAGFLHSHCWKSLPASRKRLIYNVEDELRNQYYNEQK